MVERERKTFLSLSLSLLWIDRTHESSAANGRSFVLSPEKK